MITYLRKINSSLKIGFVLLVIVVYMSLLYFVLPSGLRSLTLFLLLPASTFIAWVFGWWLGLFACTLTTLGAAFLIAHSWTHMGELSEAIILRIFLFLCTTLFINWLIEISHRTQQKLNLVLNELSEFKFALDQSSIVAVTNSQGLLTDVNDKFCKISQYNREELIGQHPRLIKSGAHSDDFFKEMWSTISTGKVWIGEICNKAKDGSLYWVFTTIVPFLQADGKPYQYMAIHNDITEKKRSEAEKLKSDEALRQSFETMRELNFKLDQAQEDERLRLSREIHDELGQALTVLKMEIFSYNKTLPDDSPMKKKMDYILDSINSLFNSMRSIVADLRPTILDDIGFEGAAEWWLQNIQNRTSIQCVFKNEMECKYTTAEQNLTLFRVLQEAVTNAIRHSGTERLEVLFYEENAHIMLSIKDFGQGFSFEAPLKRGSSGILGMKERLRPFQGELIINKGHSHGTVVMAKMPKLERMLQ